MSIDILPLATTKTKIADESSLGFGKHFTDRMFVMEYAAGKGWHSARIQPYGPFSLDPACAVLHYAQEIFEGLKAFRRDDGRSPCSAPATTSRRFNRSAARMCMPEVDEAFFLEAIKQLVRLEADWVPRSAGTSPLHPPDHDRHRSLSRRASVGHLPLLRDPLAGRRLLQGRLSPVKIWISDEYVRVAPRRHRRGQDRRQLRRQPEGLDGGGKNAASTRCSGSMPCSANMWKRSAA